MIEARLRNMSEVANSTFCRMSLIRATTTTRSDVSADRSIAIEFPGYPVVRLRPIEGLEFVEETVIALDSTTELAHHLFRECWAEGTGKHRCPDGGRGSHAPRFAWRWHR